MRTTRSSSQVYQPVMPCFFSFDSRNVSESYCPFSKYNEGWQKMNSLEPILSGYTCRNRSFKAGELQQYVEQSHSKSWCGMVVKLFLHELYPSPLTGDKQQTVHLQPGSEEENKV